MKLTGAATLVSRAMKVLQAAPAAYPCRYAACVGPMASNTYRLFFRDIEIGEIVYKDMDFPGLVGHYSLSSCTDNASIRKSIKSYIDYSVEASRLSEQGDDGDAWGSYIEQNEQRFIDLIECDDWQLMDSQGKRFRILIPNFCTNNEVVWRLA